MSAISRLQDQFVALHAGGQRDPLLEVLKRSQQYDIRIQTVSRRKLIDSTGHELVDFASCNYTSFDQDVELLLEAGAAAARKFGIHTSRARLMGYHELFTQVEEMLAEMVGTDHTLVFPNTTLAGIGIIPALLQEGDLIILDKSAHATMYQAAQMARDKGTILASYPQNDFDALEKVLQKHSSSRRKIVCVDGVYSMTGDYAKLPELLPIAQKYDALLYVDDGHGFGFVGEHPDDEMPYGYGGAGIVSHYGMTHENIMYVSGTAKGMAGAGAFACVSESMREFLMAYAKPLDYTHPPTPFAMGVLKAAIKLQEKVGDERRAKVYKLTTRLVEGLREQGFHVMTETMFPIISVWAGATEPLIEASRLLYKRGFFITSCPYPTMPRGKEAIRITITSNNDVEEIDGLLLAFEQIHEDWTRAGVPLHPEQ